MSADSWMPIYVAEHLADTTHLTTQEHGAYFLLMLTYWRNGPLPDDDKALATIAKVDRKLWAAEVGPAIRALFSAIEGRLFLNSLDIEIAFAEANSAKKSAAAHAKWAKSRADSTSTSDPPAGANGDARAYAGADAGADATGDAETYAEPMQGICPLPSPSLSKEELPFASLTPPARARKTGDPDGFGEFWASYPRRVGRGQAVKAFAAALRKAPLEAILEAVRSQRFDRRVEFIPYPATWLNGERWRDEVDTRDPVLVAAGYYDTEVEDPLAELRRPRLLS